VIGHRTETADVVLLCSPGFSSQAVFGALRSRFPSLAVIVEEPVSSIALARRRVKRLGVSKVLGQIAFVMLAQRMLELLSRRRLAAIGADMEVPPAAELQRAACTVRSANSPEAIAALKRLAPKIVVVNGTRLLSKPVLHSVDAPFINTHMGITPLYRGVHGGYWALVEKRPDLVGTTIHYVDTGIDTGGIIRQVGFEVAPPDNFATYPYLHIKSALPALMEVVGQVLEGRPPAPVSVDLPSRVRTHPTLFEYLFHRCVHKVK
jgi:folate-dependent phosphoribosylglycinamide formyltransferase PurN